MGVNPAKTELVLFTSKHRIPELVLPELNGKMVWGSWGVALVR